MSMLSKTAVFLAMALVAVLIPVAASAQDPKFRVSLGGGTTAGAIDGRATANFSVGYRFAEQFSFDVEVAGFDGAADGYRPFDMAGRMGGASNVAVRVGEIFANVRRNMPGLTGFTFPTGSMFSTDGDTLLSTVGFRFHIPTSDARFRPYVSAGLGVARTEESFDARILSADTRNRPTTGMTSIYADEVSHTGLAGGAGVGAAVRVWKGLSLGVDARYYRLDRGRDLGTFGGNVSYGF